MLRFTAMQVEHLDDVLSIEKKSFSNPWSRFTFISELLHNKYAYYIAAWEDDKVVGYGGIWLILDEAHVTNIAVGSECRGKGYGQKILGAVMQCAKAMGATAITLEVRESNIVARKLYEKNGFVARGRRKGYYSDNKEDAIVMWKDDLSDIVAQKVGENCG